MFWMTAVYRTDTWSEAKELISKNSLRVSELAERLSARRVELAELRAFDPELVSFLNINNPQAYSAFITSQGGAVDTDLMDRLNGVVRKHL